MFSTASATPSAIITNLPSDLGAILLPLAVIIVLGAIVFCLVSIFLLLQRSKRCKKKALECAFLLVTLPSQNEVEIGAAEQMFSALYSIGIKKSLKTILNPPDHLSFEIVATHEEIEFYVVCPNHLVDFVTKQINAAYSDAEIASVEPWDIWAEGSVVEFTQLKLKKDDHFPIKMYEELPVDPMNGLTSAMSNLGKGDGMAIQIVVKPAVGNWMSIGKSYTAHIRSKATEGEKPKPVDEGPLQAIDKKIAKNGFQTCIRLVSVSTNKQTAKTNLDGLVGAFEQFTDPVANKFKKAKQGLSRRNFITQFIYNLLPTLNDITLTHWTPFRKTFVLNTTELATVFHFPNKNVTTPHIVWLKSRSSAAPSDLPTEGLYLGKSVFRGEERKVFMLPDDRVRHHYIIGQTGTGKSKLMVMMAHQDMMDGRGFAYIDPHGEEIEDLLKMIPPHRLDDVVYFNPGDLEYPMGFNILDVETEEQKHLVVNSFISLLYKIYDPNRTGMIGAKLERAVRNVFLTAMSEKGNSLVEVLRMLIDEKFAQSKLPLITDPLVKKYWTDELAKTSEFHKSETLGYFVSKFDRFVTEITMRNIIGQPKTSFNFRQIMDEGKILLINLSKGLIGAENSDFLGLLLVPQILAAAMGRADVAQEKRRDFFLYVDEFQNFATPDFITILAEARKYRLGLIVANQFITQIPEDIKNAIFGNVGTMSIFRVGIDDAQYLEKQFEPYFDQKDIASNPVGHTYTRLLVKGFPTPPFSMKTDWDMFVNFPRSDETARQVIQLSRTKYARKRADVEAEINKRLGF